ncbi:D-erythronate dehydrogenase [Thalassobaculum sp.]|uniref:D-erythronate dehydrogenase n=1 Tax=Thalassobaculum sp. TaxID=2022740 RepID=UPI0032EB7878
MKIAITGGAGFLGVKLARSLLADNALGVERLTLVDMVAPPSDLATDGRVVSVTGDATDEELLAEAIRPDTNSVFHLAAVVSAGAEADFDLGMRVNLDATRTILEIARRHGNRPRLVFASSCAAYGGDLPEVVTDNQQLTPQNSYGVQKAIGELLINDYSRKGFVDGRALRYPTVVVRPGKPNKAASTFASSIIREPLQGQDAVCPVAPETAMWLASPRTIVANTRRAHDLPADAWGPWRAVALPGFTTTVGEMVAALEAIAGPEVAARVKWQRDPLIEKIVYGWPARFETVRADAMGFHRDPGMESVIKAFIEDELPNRPA